MSVTWYSTIFPGTHRNLPFDTASLSTLSSPKHVHLEQSILRKFHGVHATGPAAQKKEKQRSPQYSIHSRQNNSSVSISHLREYIPIPAVYPVSTGDTLASSRVASRTCIYFTVPQSTPAASKPRSRALCPLTNGRSSRARGNFDTHGENYWPSKQLDLTLALLLREMPEDGVKVSSSVRQILRAGNQIFHLTYIGASEGASSGVGSRYSFRARAHAKLPGFRMPSLFVVIPLYKGPISIPPQ